MPRGDSYQLQGQQGGIVLRPASVGGAPISSVGKFRWIQALEDSVIDASTGETSSNLVNNAFLDGVTLPAGVGIGGEFTKIQVSTGTVIAYYA